MAAILFLHGLEARPGGVKPTFLASLGHEVLNPALPDDDFEASVRVAEAEYGRAQPDVVVGSSRGGAVAMAMDCGASPVGLIAPAWRYCKVAGHVKGATTILHAADDAVIPLADSKELAAASGLAKERLVVVGENHSMNDPAAQAALAAAIEAAVA